MFKHNISELEAAVKVIGRVYGMVKFISNSFTLEMVKESKYTLEVEEINEDLFNQVKSDCISVVGHQDTANILGVECNSANIELTKGDVLYLAQLQGGILPEGADELPEGFSFKFLKVTLK